MDKCEDHSCFLQLQSKTDGDCGVAGVAPPLLRGVTRFHDQQEKREELCGAKGDERLRAGTVPTLPLLIFSSARCNHKLLALILVYFAKC